MKHKLLKISAVLICCASLLALSCKKDNPDISNDPAKLPILTTALSVSSITANAAMSGGTITDDNGKTVTARGVCWSITIDPTLKDSLSKDGSGVGSFTSSLRNLLPDTSYYVRAYATNADGTAYGSALNFTTLALPTVTTNSVTNITPGSATSGGIVTDTTGQNITARGVCWSTNPNPTVSLTTKTTDGTGTGLFTSSITKLTATNTYYVRSYVTCAGGTSYGNELQFMTDKIPTNTIQYVKIPAGTFTMGSPTSEVDRYNDESQFQVTLSAFKMSKFEITNAQYATFLNAKGIGSNGLHVAGAYPTEALIYTSSGSYDYGLHYTDGEWVPVAGYANHPVNEVTWYGAAEFATYAGGLLPTEAEWEYACRAGTSTPFNTGECLSDAQANYYWGNPYSTCTNTNTSYPCTTKAVGSYVPNAYGLYDMHGNVAEWCNDWYGAYPTTAQTNPTGAITGSGRVFRGGCWCDYAQDCRSALRRSNQPSSSGYSFGFRLVLPQ